MTSDLEFLDSPCPRAAIKKEPGNSKCNVNQHETWTDEADLRVQENRKHATLIAFVKYENTSAEHSVK